MVIKKPGAISDARWLQKAIYVLKMFLLRNNLDLNENDVDRLLNVIYIIVEVYVPLFYRANTISKAPRLDLDIIKKLHSKMSINPQLLTAVLTKLSNHLWYLTAENVMFSLFDTGVDLQEKRLIIKNANKKPVIGTRELKLSPTGIITKLIFISYLQAFKD